MKHRTIFRLAAMAILAASIAATGCSDDEPGALPGGGAGGISGTGGSGGAVGPSPELVELCDRACSVRVACTGDYEPDQEEACNASCLRAQPQQALLDECVACLEEVACEGARLACQHGLACDMAYDLVVRGVAFEALEGRTVRVLVAESIEGERWVDFAREVEVENGAFDVRFVGGLPSWGIPFDVVVLADADGDGACTQDVDRAWRIGIGEPTRNHEVVVRGDAPQRPDDCAYWTEAPSEIVLEGGGLEAWEGKSVIAAPVWVDTTFLTVGGFVTRTVEDGRFRLRVGDFGDYVEEMAPDSEIGIAWMVDLDGDWTCTAADAGGYGRIPEPDGLLQLVEATPADVGSAPCELLRGLGHDVRLVGSGYAAFEDAAVEAAVIGADGLVDGWARSTVRDGAFTLVFEGAAADGGSYQAAIWLDREGNAVCEIPPDAAWRFDLGTIEDDLRREVPFTGEASEASLCTLFAEMK